MPMIIPCIDDYLDEKKRDLYWVVFGQNRGFTINPFEDRNAVSANPPGREELLAWFAEHLPNVEINPIFTFRRDGGILSCPYDGSISIDFDDASLAVYCSRWETPDGKPIDPNISCYMMLYDDYIKNRGR